MSAPLPLADLHFLRPLWLWALLALPLLGWWWRARRRRDSAWRGVVDPHLLPHLLEAGGTRARSALGLVLLGAALAVLALAGPAWRQVAQPLWQSRAPLVVALDLSSASLASDLPPSRLLQARAKIATLLRRRAGGQVGLVAYAGDAFTVAPLTDDVGNVALFLDALAPDVMPVDGQRADRAIDHAVALLQRAGFARGDILLLTDHAEASARRAAGNAAHAGYRVSVLGLGTVAGAAYRGSDGRIAQARLDAASLRALAAAGDGRYADLGSGDADLAALGVLDPQQAAVAGGGGAARQWQDEGYWLLPPLLLLALFAFRRGTTAALILLAILPALPALPVQAQAQAQRQEQERTTWWRRLDQVAHARMQQGAQAYRQGDFAGAARRYAGIPTADAHYNRGNALAKQGRYPAAIAAYDEALRLQPSMVDAIANRRAVAAAMKRQPPSGGQQPPDQQRPQQDAGAQGGQQAQRQASAPAQPDASPARERAPASPPTPTRTPPKAPEPKQPQDAEAQRAADAAQRARMQRAIDDARGQADGARGKTQARAETPAERERRLANEAWLQRIPDDPGGLLRAKFRLEYERRQQQGTP